MAGKGPPPKPEAQRRRRNKRPPAKKLPVTQEPAAPALPDGHLDATVAWYATWASSPQASRFSDTDWQRLHMLAHLVDRFFTKPTKELMGEIRLNESMLGATEADRLRLNWTLERPEAETAGPAAPVRHLRVVDPDLAESS